MMEDWLPVVGRFRPNQSADDTDAVSVPSAMDSDDNYKQKSGNNYSKSPVCNMADVTKEYRFVRLKRLSFERFSKYELKR